jgi:hypothetical protein
MVGIIIRHGPHQGAQQSTTTGTAAFKTSFAKLASVTVIGQAASWRGKGAEHLPQMGLRASARSSTRFFAPHWGHVTIIFAASRKRSIEFSVKNVNDRRERWQWRKLRLH